MHGPAVFEVLLDAGALVCGVWDGCSGGAVGAGVGGGGGVGVRVSNSAVQPAVDRLDGHATANGRLPIYCGHMSTMPASEPTIHQHRQVAESFGADPERYDRARSRYPEAMVEWIAATSSGPAVLDVGSGTGIVARQFQAVGCRVLGVEPDARMAEFARGTGVEVEVATFEAWDPAGRQFDAIVSGQTWHWVDAVAGAAKAAQALRPSGRLAVFWNVFQPPPR